MSKYNIYTDGSCRKNPGPGGFGVIVMNGDAIEYAYAHNEAATTNNRQELKAILHAFELSQTRYKGQHCRIHSDSAYCVNMINSWIHTWARNGWKNTKKQTVENVDLVQEIYKYLCIEFFNCEVVKVAGHNGIIPNELADALATDDVLKFTRLIKDNNLELETYINDCIDLEVDS